MSTEEKIAELRRQYLAGADFGFERALRVAESPIEALFIAALLACGVVRGGINNLSHANWKRTKPWTSLAEEKGVIDKFASADMLIADFGSSEQNVVFVAQLPVVHETGSYRLDFAFIGESVRVAVELDGHDFHERTKEQATRDKARDRALASLGWTVLRFTGSEVYANATAVVREVADHVWNARERAEGG